MERNTDLLIILRQLEFEVFKQVTTNHRHTENHFARTQSVSVRKLAKLNTPVNEVLKPWN